MFSEEDLLPVSLLQHILFCERRAMLLHLERIWEDNLYTAEGSVLHEKAHDDVATEVRDDVRIARGLRLRSLSLGLSGMADVVEFHRIDASSQQKDPSMMELRSIGVVLVNIPGTWQPLPVEYKRGRLRFEKGYEIQLCAQAICIEEMMNVEVPSGAIFFGKTNRRKVILFDACLRQETEIASAKLHQLVIEGKTPRAEYQRKCESCSLLPACMPRIMGKGRSARKYLSQLFTKTE